MNDEIERVLAELDGFRMADEMTYSAYSRLHDLIGELDDLLKAQEPRVMTLGEVKQHNNQDGCVWFEQPTYNAVAAFVRKDEFEIEVISPYILGAPINHGYWLSSNYNVTWRCWTSRPDQATREAVKWDA